MPLPTSTWLGLFFCLFLAACVGEPAAEESEANLLPNIVFIYTDDLGYGDVSANGATEIETPNIDRIARQGMRFTNAHTTSATCTPSRFSLLTGRYAWRKPGTGIARGNAPMIIDTATTTIADVLKRAGYTTGVVGKWHLGLGGEGGPDWNSDIKPGPLEIGFDYAFLIPATGDRVPCVYMEDYRIVDLDPDDPITVSYGDPVGDWPTGRENPELLKMHPSHGHNQTIVNGISRIGYMTGGKNALWVDEDMADVLVARSNAFIEQHQDESFFLYLSTHDIHVPRVPHSRFVGKSGMGPRGDAILQLDFTVGAVLDKLDELGLADNTLVVFTSDNGPVLDDGYEDQAVELIGDHEAAGALRGGKYSIFDAGTRVPTLLRWPARVAAGQTSDALLSQVDWMASFAALTGQTLRPGEGPDSQNTLSAYLGERQQGREELVEQGVSGSLALIRGPWKYIRPTDGPPVFQTTNIESGFRDEPQLYNLEEDIAEQNNLAGTYREMAVEMANRLDEIVQNH